MFSRLTTTWQTKPKDETLSLLERSLSGPYCSVEQLMSLRLTAKNLQIPKARKILRPQTGGHQSRFRGRGMEFSEVRAYQPGDDVRSIDWRVTARRQKPHTKVFNEERERPVFIVCDQSQSQFFGSQQSFKSVRAAETAALFAWTALSHNDRVGGLVFSQQGHKEVRPARNRKRILALLSSISTFNQALSIHPTENPDPFSFNDALNETVRLVKPGTLVIVISDFRQLSEDTDKLLSKLARHNELLLARTFDPLEETLPPPGFYPVSNGSETLVINTRSSQNRTAYKEWATTQRNAVRQIGQRYAAPVVDISTHSAPLNALQGLLISLGA